MRFGRCLFNDMIAPHTFSVSSDTDGRRAVTGGDINPFEDLLIGAAPGLQGAPERFSPALLSLGGVGLLRRQQ